DRRAWHAGESRWRGRERCNDLSIGVELEGTDDAPFDARQYATLASLVAALRAALPLRAIAAHSDIAAGRKTDPGPGFDWPPLLAELAAP
ncbi:MAG: 1,6-anhydro-N-acetylmuramyl-L-alanine amidase AmpD, partial [Betaproteobacteria bacterium]